MSLPPAPPSVPVELEDEEGRRQLAYFIWGNRPKQPPPPPMFPPLPPGVNRYAWMVNSFWREFSLFYRQYVSKEIDETGKMTRKKTIEGLKDWDETMEKFAEVIFNFADQVCVWERVEEEERRRWREYNWPCPALTLPQPGADLPHPTLPYHALPGPALP